VDSRSGTAQHLALAARARRLLATWERQRDLVSLGAYSRGGDAETDEAIDRIAALENFLAQDARAPSTLAEALAALSEALA